MTACGMFDWRGFKAVDLHLIEEGYVARSDSSDCVLISVVDQEEL